MTGRRRSQAQYGVAALVLGLVVAACGTGESSSQQPPTSETEPIDQPTPVDPSMSIDWLGEFQLTLDNGWVVIPCDGDAPMICVADGDQHLGFVELGSYSFDDASPDHIAALQLHADDFLATMRSDRAAGCPDLTFEAFGPEEAVVDNRPGLRAGFQLTDADGTEVERHVLYWVVRDNVQWSITASGYATDGCMEPIGEFAPADLAVFEPALGNIVAQSPLPDPIHEDAGVQPVTDGSFEARIVRIDAPVRVVEFALVEMLSWQEALDAARANGAIGPSDDLPNDFYIRELGGESVSVRLDGTLVSVVDCHEGCRDRVVSVDAFLTGEVRALNGDAALFALELVDGRATELREIYLP